MDSEKLTNPVYRKKEQMSIINWTIFLLIDIISMHNILLWGNVKHILSVSTQTFPIKSFNRLKFYYFVVQNTNHIKYVNIIYFA